MSANNLVVIRKTKEKTFVVSEYDYESGKIITPLGTFSNLEKALEEAQDFCTSEEVEYGIEYIKS